MKINTKLWLGILGLIILSPLGLILPKYFKAESAWGEWGAEEIQKLFGYVPKGLAQCASLWKAPLPGYAFKGGAGKSLAQQGFSYIISALLGVVIIIGLVLLLAKLFFNKKD